jgi:long-chain acyl-CoA synthetase
MPLAKLREVQDRFGCPLLELWGMTEIAGLGTTHPFLGANRLGSIGVPLPYVRCRIACPDAPQLTRAPGEVGELLVRGPILMNGYYRQPEATSETIDADGWLHTGDLAKADTDGFLYVVDRLKDMIVTAGYNVYPAEIERVIAEHADVSLVAVAGIPDEIKGEAACAYIVQKRGANLDEGAILRYCRERLAAYKVPRSVRFVPDLPKTSSGKILRRQLKSLR